MLTMPEVAESVVEGTVARWLKQEGDQVERFETVVEIVTDKVDVEVPSPVSGVLTKILVPENTTVPVGTDLALLEEDAREAADVAVARPAPVAVTERHQPPAGPSAAGAESQPRHSPLVRRLAEQHGVDLTLIQGTGIRGRVRKQDVLDHVARRDGAAQETPVLPVAVAPTVAPEVLAKDQSIPLTPVRATIARRMAKSAREIPHAWTTFEADVTGLVELRESSKEAFRGREGIDLTYLPFFIKAVVGALKEHPEMNAVWGDDQIVVKGEINIGVAIDRDVGLIVPVVRHAEDKSIAGLAKELDPLIKKAREGRLAIEDIQGGTFTITNTGSFGAVMSMPIINQPQVAILATEAIIKRPAVVDDQVAVRSIMHISISFDHRALDGGQVGRFMQQVKRGLEAYRRDTPIY